MCVKSLYAKIVVVLHRIRTHTQVTRINASIEIPVFVKQKKK